MEKKLYAAPVAKLHEIVIEENFLASDPLPGYAGETNSYNEYDVDY